MVGGPFGSDLTQRDYVAEPGVPVIRGSNLDGKNSRFIDDGFVYVSERKAVALSKNLAFPGDLIFTQRGTLGQVAVIPELARFSRYVISQSQMKLTPDDTIVDRSYLYHYFRVPRTVEKLLSEAQATGVPHINLGILKRFRVLLPPLPEQRRIAEILDKADALRAKRRVALAQLDTLTQSIFLDMFGDPTLNPKGWKVRSLSEIGVRFRYGTSNKSAGDGKWTLRIPNVIGGSIDVDDLKRVPVTGDEFDRLRLEAGDLLFVRTNGNPDYVGRCAVYDPESINDAGFEGRDFIFASYLIRGRISGDSVAPTFLREYLTTREGRRSLRARSKTSAGQYNINTAGLGAIRVIVPPAELQREFVRQANNVAAIRRISETAAKKVDALFASLQHRAFRGEL